ncbi:MAG: multi-sensor hybrid histidine kinase [Phycisphaerales bacterium]|nr:multi-sensor hybrid histidine kinase [Phycisphaerales bacterium]
MRILLVEDNVDIQLLLRRRLGYSGHDVWAVGTAGEALAKCDKRHFDLVISDIGLPDMSGWELLPAIHQRQAVTAIAVSAFSAPGDFERSRVAGFFAHLVKPIAWETLVATMAQATNSKSLSTPHPPASTTWPRRA